MKKRIIYLLLCVCMVLTAAPMAAMAEETQAAPVEIAPTYDWYDAEKTTYEIDSIEDLAGLAKLTQGDVVIDETTTLTKTYFANKTVKLTADLTFAEGQYWYYNDGAEGNTDYDYRIYDFVGTFDGAVAGSAEGTTHTIKNMKFVHTAGTNQNVGLFTKVMFGGLVKNLTIDSVTASVGKEVRFGTVAGYLFGNLDNCHVKNVNVTSDIGSGVLRAAGLVCYPQGTSGKVTVSGCSVDGFVVNENSTHADAVLAYVAGFMGSVSGDVEITECETENVTITGPYFQNVSGFIGRARGSSAKPLNFIKCSASSVKLIDNGDTKYVGGFIGDVSYVNIIDCQMSDITMTIKGSPNKTGGFIGVIAESNQDRTNLNTVITNCNITGLIMNFGDESTDYIQSTGGFIGQAYGGNNTIDDCHVTGLNATLIGYLESSFGGFITTVATTMEIKNSSASGNIDATSVVDYKYTGETDIYCQCDDIPEGIEGTALGRPGQVGGFLGDIGYNGCGNLTLDKCDAMVNIDAHGPAGGFIASSWPYSSGAMNGSITVTDCNAYGNVTSTDHAAGGFIGVGDRGTYSNCTANGSVSGVTAGGFAGEITPNKTSTLEPKTVIITGSAANGQVLGTDTASGFVGNITTSGENDTNTTTVTVSNSTAAPVVAGATKDTNVVDFAKETIPTGSTSHYTSSENSDAEATITVKDEASGGAVTMNNGVITVPSGTKVELKTETETKTFENGTNITVNNNQVVFVPTVTFDANGGSSDFTSADVEADGTLASLPDAEKDYYDFAGWFTAEGNKVDADTKFTENTTVYAEWEAKSYSVTLDVNGGSVNNADDVTEYTYGIGAALPENVTKVGYLFAGWFENEACEGDAVTEIATDDFGAKTFYAKWVECGHDNMQLVNTDPDGHYNECSECGYESDKTEHDYTVLKTSAGEHWYECSVCRAEDTANRASHSGGTAYCTAKAVCTVCNTAYGELDADNHASNAYTYTDCGLTHAKLHSCCGEREVYEGHTYENGSCVCGASEPAKEDSNACEVIADIVEIAHEIVWRNLALHIINAITSIFG